MNLQIYTYLFLFFCAPSLFAQSTLDQELLSYTDRFRLQPLQRFEDSNPALTKLGESLFKDSILSSQNNISCQDCHQPEMGSSDGLPVSLGTGAEGLGHNRRQAKGQVTRRHANHLYNKGFPEFTHLFWDGRVRLNHQGVLETPEPLLVQSNPAARKILALIQTPLEAQALFPMSDEVEMFGENPKKLNNLKKWQLIADRVYKKTTYGVQFQKIFNVAKKDFNIGYIAKALAHFQKINFQATNTPWDQYLRGDPSVMSLSEKKGALLFLTKARCIACHSGKHLGGVSFQSAATPQLLTHNLDEDLGRFEITQSPNHRYKFRIAPLRNVAKTAPYFHNGLFTSLVEVIEHYNNPSQSLKHFDVHAALNVYRDNIEQTYVNMSALQIEKRVLSLPRFYQHHPSLNLSNEEKTNLLNFLRISLSED